MDFTKFGAKPSSGGAAGDNGAGPAADFSKYGAKAITPDQQVKAAAEKELTTGQALLETGKSMAKAGIDLFNKDAGMVAGASYGAAQGAAMGAPLGPVGLVAGVLSGAYIGGAAGQAATEAVNATVNAIAPLTGTASADPSASFKKIPERIAKGGETGAELELGGRSAGLIASEGAGAAMSYLKSEHPAVLRAIKTVMERDIMPTLAEISQSRTMAALEGHLAKLPIVGRRIAAAQAEREAAFNAWRQDVISSAGPAELPEVTGTKTYQSVREHLDEKLAQRQKELMALQTKATGKQGASLEQTELGEKLGALRNARLEVSRQAIGDAYGKFDAAVPAEMNRVPDTNARKWLLEKEKEFERIAPELPPEVAKRIQAYKNGPGGAVVDETGSLARLSRGDATIVGVFGNLGEIGAAERAAAEQALAKRQDYTFREMSAIISGLTEDIKAESLKSNPFGKAAEGGTTKAGKMLGDLKDAFLKDFQSASERLPSAPLAEKEAADAMYKIHKGKFFNPDVAKLAGAAKEHPDRVFSIFAKPNNASGVGYLKEAVGEEGMVPFRRKLVDTMILDKDGALLPEPAIARNLMRMKETLQAALTPAQLSDLTSAAKEMRLPKFMEGEVEARLRTLIEDTGAMGHGAAKMRPPEEITKRVLDGDSITIKALRNVVGPEGMRPYRRAIVEKALSSPPAELPMSGGTTLPPADQVSDVLKSYGRTVDYLFSKDEIAEMKRIGEARTLLESQKNLTGGGSGLAAKIATGALFTAAGGGAIVFHPVAGTAAVLLTPELLSRFYVSKAGRELLLRGMSEGAAKNAALSGRISAYALNAMKGRLLEDAEAVGGVEGAKVQVPAVPEKKEKKVEPPVPPSALSPAAPAPDPSALSPEARRVLGQP